MTAAGVVEYPVTEEPILHCSSVLSYAVAPFSVGREESSTPSQNPEEAVRNCLMTASQGRQGGGWEVVSLQLLASLCFSSSLPEAIRHRADQFVAKTQITLYLCGLLGLMQGQEDTSWFDMMKF